MTPAPTNTERFVRNALWNGIGFAVSIGAGILLSPYIIRKIGPEGYGIWALVFALVDYVWLTDLGFRSSVLKFSAHYLALGERKKIDETINTALVYFGAAAAVLLVVCVVLSPRVARRFNVSPADEEVFAFLLLAVGASWSIGLVINVFKAALEGFQLYGPLNRVTIVTVGIRAGGSALLLWKGYGLRELGIMVVASQMVGYALTYVLFRRAVPAMRYSMHLVSGSMLRQMMGYGIHTFLATIATQLLNQGPLVLIGRMLSAASVGFFSLPVRLLTNAVDAVAQVGMITSASSADFSARGDLAAVFRMGIYTNRYCLVLFFPLSLFLAVYGRELFLLWVGPEFAANSAPLLPVLAMATAFAVAGQRNSSAILYGLGTHAGFGRSLMAEALLTLGAMAYTLPRYGVLGVAWITAVGLVLNRGLLVPWLLCRHLNAPLHSYLAGIYARPFAAAAPVVALVVTLKLSGLDGSSWGELALAAVVIGFAYYGIALAICLEQHHRRLLWRQAAGWVAALRPMDSP